MKDTLHSLILSALLLAGCGRAPAPTASDDQLRQPARAEGMSRPDTASEEVAWDPSLLEGGYMFKDVEEFHGYVRRAEIVAAGILSEWDGFKGKVQVDSVYHGKLSDKAVRVISTGGIVRPKVGDKVLFMLSHRDGELKLHSFCGASGLYNYSDDLASALRKSIKSAG